MRFDSAYNIVSNKELLGSEWSLESYCSYLDYIGKNISLSEDNCLEQVISFAGSRSTDKPFKLNLEVGSIQFLFGVFPKEKKIRAASRQLSFELSLLNSFGSKEELKDIKNHAERIAEIPLENSPAIIDLITAKHKLIDFDEVDLSEVYGRAEDLAINLVREIKTYKVSFFEKISDFGLDLTANFMLVRVHLLKFLAILPSLDHDKRGSEVKRTLLEALRRIIEDSREALEKKLRGQKRALPQNYIYIFRLSLNILKYIPQSALARVVRKSVSLMAQRFIAGENIHKADRSLKKLLSSGRTATIDQLGELVVSNKEADEYTEKVLKVILGLSSQIEKGEKNKAGINSAHVSIKVSALASDFKPQDYAYTFEQVSPRLRRILVKACEYDVFVNIDAEHYHFRDIVLDIYSEVLLTTTELADYDQTGIVVQAYLRDGIKHLNEVYELAKKRSICMPIRLVKGAYWDAETIEADAHNFDAPQFLNKEETDIHFRQLVYKSFEMGKYIQLALASHNIQDHCFAEALRELRFKDAPIIEHQCLHMTYEGLSVGLSRMDWPTRNYIPVGDLLVGMAYLVRRIMENSSQVGVLTIMRSHKKSLKIKPPHEVLSERRSRGELDYDLGISKLTREFKNVHPIRTYLKASFNRVDLELMKLKTSLDRGVLICDNGDQEVVCSSNPKLLLGRFKNDTKESINLKIAQLSEEFGKQNWKNNKNLTRFQALYRLADILLERREELTSIIILEAGKTIDEACADVDEACDFIHFYLREQVEVERKSSVCAKGVVGVIAPWNFPLAISCGMTVAGLVAGNSVILKPAEQTPLIALKLLDLCYEAGIPKEVLQIALGEAEVGRAIVDHNLISGIVFTGSKTVGESIYKKVMSESNAKVYTSDSSLPLSKFAVTEMGGKNAIIVTNNCELDETVSGIIYSAFAHSGQKCSAASRIIIDNEVKNSFIDRFVSAVRDIKVGESYYHSTLINPLISLDDKKRVQKMAELAREEVEKFGGRVLLDESKKDYPGFCVGPSIFELDANTVLRNETMASREVFGPLLHIVGYNDLDQALEIFNSTNYALTGGIYCQSQDDVDYLAPRMLAGNIYINRPNTGARVAIEPFGGFKMSGTGPKAGSADYLRVFNQRGASLKSKTEVIDVSSEVKSSQTYSSKLSYAKREETVLSFTNNIIDQFERYFQKITEREKDILLSFVSAVSDGEFNLEEKEYPNRDIPGQVSFTKRDFILGNGIVLDTSKFLEVEILIDVLINLLIGNGISIVAQNDSLYKQWKPIFDLGLRLGFSSNNLSLGCLGLESSKEALRSSEYSFVVFTNNDLQNGLKSFLLGLDFEDKLIRIIDAGYNESWSDGIVSFTHARAYAVNTMRHGAPLELSL